MESLNSDFVAIGLNSGKKLYFAHYLQPDYGRSD